MELIGVCRVCMKQEEIYWSLYSHCNVLPEGFNAAYLITECVGVSVDPDDGLPDVLCQQCLKALLCAHNIRQTCLASDRKMRKQLQALSTLKQIEEKTDILATAVALVEQDEILETVTVDHYTSPLIIEQQEVQQEEELEQPEPEPEEQQQQKQQQQEYHIPEDFGAELQVDVEQYANAESLDGFVEEGDDTISSENSKLLMEEVELQETEYCEGHPVECDDDIGMRVEIVDNSTTASKAAYLISPAKDVKKSHKDNFTCDICLKTFSTKGNLKSHSLLHTDQKPFACEVCGVRFAKKGNLKVHLARHSDVRSVKCPCCEKSFVHEVNLRNHMRKHTGEKPFACCYCTKRFAYLSDRKRHEMRHTGNYPYRCVNCEKKFIRKQSYLVHINKCYDGTISLVESVEDHSSDDSQPSVGQ